MGFTREMWSVRIKLGCHRKNGVVNMLAIGVLYRPIWVMWGIGDCKGGS